MLFTNTFSDLYDTLFPEVRDPAPRRTNALMSTDITEYADRYELSMDLAGFSKENITAEVKEGVLTIHAKREAPAQENAEGKLIRSERFSGECRRSFTIGEDVEQDAIRAAFADGVLTLTIPKAAPKLPENRRIAIS